MIRVTLDIRTDLDPATIYHWIEDKLEEMEIVAGSAELVDARGLQSPRIILLPPPLNSDDPARVVYESFSGRLSYREKKEKCDAL